MSRYDAIVIGGGINGLVAGTSLARRGKSVCLLEQRSELGGMATLADGDGPPLAHTLYNLSPLAMKEFGLDAADLPFRTEPLTTVSLCDTGKHVVLHGRDATFADGSPHPEAHATKALLDRLAAHADLLRGLAEAPPPGQAPLLSGGGLKQLWRLGRFGMGVKRQGKREMRRFLQLLLSNARDMILDEIPDGPLAGLLAADAVRGAATGPSSPGTVFNLLYRFGHGGVVTRPADGMNTVFDTIADVARAAGVEIRTHSRVARILVENDKVTGVETGAGTVLSAPLVLAGLSPKRVMDLTGPGHEDIETVRQIRNIRARGTTAKVNFRLSAPLRIPGMAETLRPVRLIVAPSVDYVETAFNPAKYGHMSDNPVLEAVELHQADVTWLSVIVQFAPSDLTGGWSEAARDALLAITLETLGRRIPDLPGTVTASQVITPDQIETATGAPGGHWHHGEMALDQLFTLRPAGGLSRYQMGPSGLYLCGAASHPGGDVMGLAGRNAARLALEARR